MDNSSPPNIHPTRVRWLVFGLACAVSWLLYLHRYSWGVIKFDVQEEYPDLTDVEMGWLDSCFLAAYTLGQVPGGWAGDRFGPRIIIPLLIVAWSLGVGATSLAVGLVSFALVRMFFGLAQAGVYPNLSKVTRNWFPASARTTVQGLVASLSGRAGGACAALLVASCLMGWLELGWRESLVIAAVPGLALAVAFWFYFRNHPSEHPWTNAAEIRLIDPAPNSAATLKPARLRLGGARTITLAALLLYAFASTFADQLFVFWIPKFLKKEKGLDTVAVGIFASLPLWGGAIGGAVGGVLNDFLIRVTGNRCFARRAVAFTGKLLGGLLLAVSILVADGRWVMIVLMIGKFFGDWSLSTQWGTLTDIGGRASGTVFGIVNMVGSSAGFIAGPIIGWIIQEYQWDVLFVVLGGVFALAALCWLVIDCTQKLVDDEPASVSR